MFSTYRIQSVDLESKSIDWFPYDENIDRLGINNQRHQWSSATCIFFNFEYIEHIMAWLN